VKTSQVSVVIVSEDAVRTVEKLLKYFSDELEAFNVQPVASGDGFDD
jgi:hypothetical protein